MQSRFAMTSMLKEANSSTYTKGQLMARKLIELLGDFVLVFFVQCEQI
jgi:hypothetical protein